MNKKTAGLKLGLGITHLIHYCEQPMSNAKPVKCVFNRRWFLKFSETQELEHIFILLHEVQ